MHGSCHIARGQASECLLPTQASLWSDAGDLLRLRFFVDVTGSFAGAGKLFARWVVALLSHRSSPREPRLTSLCKIAPLLPKSRRSLFR